jgi:hypothetical protein
MLDPFGMRDDIERLDALVASLPSECQAGTTVNSDINDFRFCSLPYNHTGPHQEHTELADTGSYVITHEWEE